MRLKVLTPGAWRETHPDGPATSDASERRLTAELRLALALVTVMIAAGSSTAPPLLLPIATAYLIYASVVRVAGSEFDRDGLAASLAQYYPIDAGAFLLLMSISGAHGLFASLFAIYLFIFAVTGASLSWGTGAGLRLTVATLGLFAAAIPFRALIATELEATETFLSLGSLLGVGTIAARRGGREFTVRSRLLLLRDAGIVANPRFGVDRTIDALLERLREFYEADVCVLTSKSERGHDLRYVSRAHHPSEGRRWVVPRAEDLPYLPQNVLAVYVRPRWFTGRPRTWFGDRADGRVCDCQLPYRPASIHGLLGQLGGRSWLSVPAFADQQYVGRLHIVGSRTFTPSDAKFALQVMETGLLLVENIRLVDQLATSAAHRERQRVARDIHDSVIQPYVGLQLGLIAVQRILRTGDLATAEEKVGQLVHLTGTTIDELRTGIHGLKAGTGNDADHLLRAIQLHANRFSQDTGIPVDIDAIDAVRCGDRLAAELFQMAVEALSNVRRHTAATRASIRFKTDEQYVRLQVENSGSARGRATPFMPRSISERAAALGGYVTVDRHRDGRSMVEITIPL